MSAIKNGSELDPKDATKSLHHFEQKVPIPSYLIAIVVGALESRWDNTIAIIESNFVSLFHLANPYAASGIFDVLQTLLMVF